MQFRLAALLSWWVRDYVPEASVFLGRTLRDGSRYFDRPSYHDYLSTTPGVEQRIRDTLDDADFAFDPGVVARFTAPFQDDYYVPQGVAASPDGGELFLSMYYNARHEDPGCSEVNPDDLPSIIVGFDPCEAQLTRVYLLHEATLDEPNTSHVGGLAVVPDAQGQLVALAPAHGGLARYAIDDEGAWSASTVADLAPPDLLPSGAPRLIAYQRLETAPVDDDCGMSFLSYDASTHSLWTGTFNALLPAPLCRYELDASAQLATLALKVDMPLPRVQGVAVAPSGEVLLSTSYGNNTSWLYRWPLDGAPVAIARGPAGFEDLAVTPQGLVWTVSESGGKYYQKRGNNPSCSSPWTALYPYVFAFHLE